MLTAIEKSDIQIKTHLCQIRNVRDNK